MKRDPNIVDMFEQPIACISALGGRLAPHKMRAVRNRMV